jgi:hypothetical protein
MFEAKARALREQRLVEHDAELERLRGDLELQATRISEEEESRKWRVTLSECHLTLEEKADLEAEYQGNQWPESRAAALRMNAMEAPSPPHAVVQTALERESGRWVEPQASRPPWLATMCHNRAVWADAAVMVADSGELYKFVYATQSPLFAVFARMEEVGPEDNEVLPSATATVARWQDWAKEQWRHTYQVELTSFVAAHQLGCNDSAGLLVVPGLRFTKAAQLVTDEEAIPWHAFHLNLPQRQPLGVAAARRL